MGVKTVIVRSTGNGKYEQEVISGKHHQIADEPLDMGGDDNGPNPYAYLMAALGACTSMTLQMYADRKEWPLEGVEVHITHEKIDAADCDDCETKTGKIDKFIREIRIFGDDLTEDQRARLMEIADKCPVHKTLTNEVIISSSVYKGDPPSSGSSAPGAPNAPMP